jgi:hypothetical protein
LVLALLTLASARISAQTVDVYVNPTTWAYDSQGGTGTFDTSLSPYSVTALVYGSYITRKYYCGEFDVVVIRNKDTLAVIQTLSSCNNVFYTQGTTAYKLSNGYNGSGISGGVINTWASFSNGDLYIGGSFTVAGGYSHTQYFSCYRFQEGWSGVNEVEVNGEVWQFSWPGYKLKVDGDFDTVYGPLTSGGTKSSITGLSNVAYWKDAFKTFPNCWWTSN